MLASAHAPSVSRASCSEAHASLVPAARRAVPHPNRQLHGPPTANQLVDARRPAQPACLRAQRTSVVTAVSARPVVAAGGAAAEIENVVIIGSGPAGYTAAIYCARANLKPVVFEGFRNGRGGQLMTTTEVENFPGFPEGITGPDLMDRMRQQAVRWGSELYTEDVEWVDLSMRPFRVRTSDRDLRAHSIIIATGATAKRLGLPSEGTFWSKGISACAICDGASPLFKQQEVAVVGGGDSATEEAVYVTKYAKHVHLLVRGDRMRASKAMQDRVLANPNITVHVNTGVHDAYGDGVLQGLTLVDTRNGNKRDLPVRGLFYGIGHTPNSGLVAGQVELDAAGYVKVSHGVATSVPGVYAAGDLHDTEWRQAVTAAGSGCMAALSVERYLTSNNLVREFKQQQQAEEHHARANGNGAAGAAAAREVDTPETFDITQDKHKGQFALRKLYHESDRLIAVLYSSPTCGPCRTLKPIFSGVMDEFKGLVHYVEIDIEADPEIAEAAGVMGTPTVQFFKDKEQLVSMSGVKMKKDYRSFISQHVQQSVMA